MSTNRAFYERLASLPEGVAREEKGGWNIGQKRFAFDDHRDHDKQAELLLSEQWRALSAGHVSIQKGLSRGLWSPDENVVKVITQKGTWWATTGYVNNGRLLLTPFEALFMMESGSLELLQGGVPMSVQQAFHSLLQPCDLDMYQVYAWLKRAGYIVQEACIGAVPLLEMWQTRSSFCKSQTNPPDCRVMIARPTDALPSDATLQQLSKPNPPVPLWCAVVDGCGIAFYTLSTAEIQTT